MLLYTAKSLFHTIHLLMDYKDRATRAVTMCQELIAEAGVQKNSPRSTATVQNVRSTAVNEAVATAVAYSTAKNIIKKEIEHEHDRSYICSSC